MSEPTYLASVRRLESRITAAIEPLRREMRLMGWPAEHRTVVWEAVARRAMELAVEAEKEKTDAVV